MPEQLFLKVNYPPSDMLLPIHNQTLWVYAHVLPEDTTVSATATWEGAAKPLVGVRVGCKPPYNRCFRIAPVPLLRPLTLVVEGNRPFADPFKVVRLLMCREAPAAPAAPAAKAPAARGAAATIELEVIHPLEEDASDPNNPLLVSPDYETYGMVDPDSAGLSATATPTSGGGNPIDLDSISPTPPPYLWLFRGTLDAGVTYEVVVTATVGGTSVSVSRWVVVEE